MGHKLTLATVHNQQQTENDIRLQRYSHTLLIIRWHWGRLHYESWLKLLPQAMADCHSHNGSIPCTFSCVVISGQVLNIIIPFAVISTDVKAQKFTW